MNNKVLPTEEEIIHRVEADWSKPIVTFLCTTYNQQDYIADTIEGFLIQKTSFPYEIIIHDDCSTDGTKRIIDSYKVKYPRLIKTIYQKENQYSQGNSVTLIAAKQARAEYIALCEGDDYWINENKIEKQLSLMLDDPSITMVVSTGKLRFNEKISNKLIGYHGDNIKQIFAQYILDCAGSLAPTASYVIKKDYLIKARDVFRDAPVGDLFIELYNAVYGKLMYYPEVMCIYRSMAKNSWSERMALDLDNAINNSKSMQKTIEISKELDSFDSLDWSNFRANNFFNLAILHLYHNNIEGFKKYITLSDSYKILIGHKKIIFELKDHGKFLYFLLHTRKYIKYLCTRQKNKKVC